MKRNVLKPFLLFISKACVGWWSTCRDHVLMYLTGQRKEQIGKPQLLAVQRILKVKNRVSSNLYTVIHLNGRGELLVSCVYLAFICNQNNVQTHGISRLNYQKVTLGIKEANMPCVSPYIVVSLQVWRSTELMLIALF